MPSTAIQTFVEPHEYQAAIRASDVTVLLAGRGELRVKLTRMDLHKLWMRSGETSLPYLMHGAWPKDRSVISFLTGAEPTPYLHNGMELGPGFILANPAGAEFYRRSTGRACGSMSLTLDDLAAAGRAIVGKEVTVGSAARIVRPQPKLMARLLHQYEAAERLAATSRDVLAHPQVALAMEQELIRTLVHCLADATQVNMDRPRISVMQRFLEALRAAEGKPRYVAEICAEIGVPERTLRAYCLDQLGVSPKRYLWLRRMHQARRQLALRDVGRQTVTEVATDHGFWELGRFSVAYRQLFGESPSATLRLSQRATRDNSVG